MSEKDWFASWFDTSYYHILYDHRNEEEAVFFIQKLIEALQIQPGAKALDLACGKGRHAITLHTFGLEVLGVDLSEKAFLMPKAMQKRDLNLVCMICDFLSPIIPVITSLTSLRVSGILTSLTTIEK